MREKSTKIDWERSWRFRPEGGAKQHLSYENSAFTKLGFLMDTPDSWILVSGFRCEFFVLFLDSFWEIDFYPVRVLGRFVDLPIRMPNPSSTLDKNLASMGPGILSSIGVGVWRKAPEAFPGSNTTLDTFQSRIEKKNLFLRFPWPAREPLFRPDPPRK